MQNYTITDPVDFDNLIICLPSPPECINMDLRKPGPNISLNSVTKQA